MRISGIVLMYTRSRYMYANCYSVSFVTKYKAVKVWNSDQVGKLVLLFFFFFSCSFSSSFIPLWYKIVFWYNEPKSVDGNHRLAAFIWFSKSLFFSVHNLNTFFSVFIWFACCTVGQTSYSGQFTMSCASLLTNYTLFTIRVRRKLSRQKELINVSTRVQSPFRVKG